MGGDVSRWGGTFPVGRGRFPLGEGDSHREGTYIYMYIYIYIIYNDILERFAVWTQGFFTYFLISFQDSFGFDRERKTPEC